MRSTMHILFAKMPAASSCSDAMDGSATITGEGMFCPAAAGGCVMGAWT
jgi:hypothetical protein